MGASEILVADDELYITTMLSIKLRQAGYAVRTATDGEEALAMALDSVPHLIVTDFQMPILSGFDLAVRLRAEHKTANIPLLMLTARGHKLESADMARTNIRSLLAKPFSLRELLSKIDELLLLKTAGASSAPISASDAAG
jgi:DNA-binding response OmpR family regulator